MAALAGAGALRVRVKARREAAAADPAAALHSAALIIKSTLRREINSAAHLACAASRLRRIRRRPTSRASRPAAGRSQRGAEFETLVGKVGVGGAGVRAGGESVGGSARPPAWRPSLPLAPLILSLIL